MDFKAAEVIEEFETFVKDEVRALAGRVVTAAIDLSPVDTGRFRASWRVGLGGDPVAPVDAKPDPSGQSTKAFARATLSTYRREHGNIHVVNAEPYADRIDSGFSRKAPTGISALAVAAGVAGGPDDGTA